MFCQSLDKSSFLVQFCLKLVQFKVRATRLRGGLKLVVIAEYQTVMMLSHKALLPGGHCFDERFCGEPLPNEVCNVKFSLDPAHSHTF